MTGINRLSVFSALIFSALIHSATAGNILTGSLLTNPGIRAARGNPAVTSQAGRTAALRLSAQATAALHPPPRIISSGAGNNRITLIQLKDPTAVPAQALRSFHSQGKVYVVNGNGIIFGGPHQVNTHELTGAAMGATSNADNGYLEKQRKQSLVRRNTHSVIRAKVIHLGN